MFDNHTNTVVTAPQSGGGFAPVVPLTSEQMRDTIDQLRIIREFIYSELKDGTDYGRVAGCGDKPTLLQPGAQKICMFFNVYPDYEVERKDGPNGHVDYIVKTTLVSRTTGLKVGSGVGSCSTLEKKYRYRRQDRVCPKCGAETIRSSKTGGFFCGVRAGGCGASFAAGDPAIVNQKVGLVDNEDVADSYNTVLKMAKKRSFVDATLSLSCISEFFTQDLEERGELQPAGHVQPYSIHAGRGSRAQGFAPPAAAEAPPPSTGPEEELMVAESGPAAPPAADWRDHEHVAEYNRLFEQLVQESGTLDSDREPAFRAFVKNEWVKLTRGNGFEARPDKVPAEAFATTAETWFKTVRKAIKERTTGVKPSRRQAKAA